MPVNKTGWKAYLEVCKPKVVATMLFTALVGMFMASAGDIPWQVIFAGITGIGLVASAAAAINQAADYRIDAVMKRTQARPLPSGQLTKNQVLFFALVLGVAGSAILSIWTNTLTVILTLASLIGYAVVYTRYLKYATPQNIVIGGAAGAAPPLLGWVAVTGSIDAGALILFAIIFVWTPPHFWALALYRIDDYRDAAVPMLPITHGEDLTRTHILLYTLLLSVITTLPFIVGLAGTVYMFGALLLNAIFICHTIALKATQSKKWAQNTFVYSILYLLILFATLMLDAYLPLLMPLISTS